MAWWKYCMMVRLPNFKSTWFYSDCDGCNLWNAIGISGGNCDRGKSCFARLTQNYFFMKVHEIERNDSLLSQRDPYGQRGVLMRFAVIAQSYDCQIATANRQTNRRTDMHTDVCNGLRSLLCGKYRSSFVWRMDGRMDGRIDQMSYRERI